MITSTNISCSKPQMHFHKSIKVLAINVFTIHWLHSKTGTKLQTVNPLYEPQITPVIQSILTILQKKGNFTLKLHVLNSFLSLTFNPNWHINLLSTGFFPCCHYYITCRMGWKRENACKPSVTNWTLDSHFLVPSHAKNTRMGN